MGRWQISEIKLDWRTGSDEYCTKYIQESKEEEHYGVQSTSKQLPNTVLFSLQAGGGSERIRLHMACNQQHTRPKWSRRHHIWRWTAIGQYNTSSAYKIQFTTNFCRFKISPIWKARTEPKCRFFAWSLLHNRIVITNNLQKRGWPCNLICCLCNLSPETTAHLCKDCPFTGIVWNKILAWADLRFLSGTPNTGSLYAWWRRLRTLCSKQSRKSFDCLLIYFWWTIWLKRNNRVFQQQQRTTNQVAQLVKGLVGGGITSL
jgi:hypothetical protein